MLGEKLSELITYSIFHTKNTNAHDRKLYLTKRWYRRAMQYNRGLQDYIENHTHNKRINCGARTAGINLQMGHKPQENVTIKIKTYNQNEPLTFGQRSSWLAYIGNPKNCNYKKIYKKNLST